MAVNATSSFLVSIGGSSTGTGTLDQVNAITGGVTGSPLFDITASIAASLNNTTLSPASGTIYVPHSLTINTSLLGSTGIVTVSSALGNVSASGGELIKDGVGTLFLTGFNNYSGGTEVKAGTLRGTGASLSGHVTVDGGATLNFQAIGGEQSSFLGEMFVLANGIASIDVLQNNKLVFLHDSVNGSGISLATGATAFLDFANTGSTIEGISADLGASTISSAAHSTIKNLHLGDSLILDDFKNVKDTSFTLSGGTLTVADSVDSLTAVFGITSSLVDDTGEKLVILHDSLTGAAALTPALDVTVAADGTGTGTLRHAVAVANGIAGSHEVIAFDHLISGSTVSLPSSSLTGSVNITASDLRFYVDKGDAITIDGGALITTPAGGLSSTIGFHKSGGGSLTLTGNEIGLGGVVTIGAGMLDVETTHITTTTYHFGTGNNATLAGTSQTLGGHTIENFSYGDSLKLGDFDFSGAISLSFTPGGSLMLTQTPPSQSLSPITATLTLSGGSASDFVLLRDSTDGSALIRPATAVSDAVGFANTVTILTSFPYQDTSGNVLDLSAAISPIDLTTISKNTTVSGVDFDLGSNKILLDTNGADAAIYGALKGSVAKVGLGTLELVGDETNLGTISIGGGVLQIGDVTEQSVSQVTSVDLASGHGTVSGTVADIDGTQINGFHLGNAIIIDPLTMGDVVSVSAGANGLLTISETGTTPESGTLDINALAGFSSVTTVDLGCGFTEIIPVITGTVHAAPADLGEFTAISSTGILDLTKGGEYRGGFEGSGTIAVDVTETQTVRFSGFDGEGSANLGDGTGGSSAAKLQINSGTLDLTGTHSYTGIVQAALTGQHTLLQTTCGDNVFNFHTGGIAIGSAIDVEGFDPLWFAGYQLDTATGAFHILVDDGVNPVHSIFDTTLPGTLSNTTGASNIDGGLQVLTNESATGVLISFGNETITADISTLATGNFDTRGKPATLKLAGALAPGQTVIDLTPFASIGGGNITALDVTAFANATVMLNATEFSNLATIRGSGTTLRLSDSSATYDLTGHSITGVSGLDISGTNTTVLIGGTLPTGLSLIHGNANGSDTLDVTTTSINLSGVQFTGDGHITSTATGATTYTISDGSIISHIIKSANADVVNLTLGANFSADDVGAASAEGLILEQNSLPIPSPFTPPGGSPAVLLVSIGGSLSPSAGVAHFVLPSGPQNLAGVPISGGSDANPVVLFGSPGSPVTLPGSVSGQTNVEYVVNSGNNLITAGSAPAEIWGGSGHDSIGLTTGAGTLVGGSGTAVLNGGMASGSVFGGAGTVELFGALGGGTLSGGGDHSILISGGGSTTLYASSVTIAGGLHQAFFGSHDTTPGACDTFYLTGSSGTAQNLVFIGSAQGFVQGGLDQDTVFGGTGLNIVNGGEAGETLFYVGNGATGGKEQTTVTGSAIASLTAYGGDGHDFLQASSGGTSTLVGGIGTDTFAGSYGNGYMLSQGIKDIFSFSGVSPAATGTFFVEGFTAGVDLLSITSTTSISGSALISNAHQVTILSTDVTSATDPLEAHLVGMTALQFVLSNGEKVDLVGVSTLSVTDVISIYSPPA